MTLISVHLPKTAGTSFGHALQAHFGAQFRADYADGGLSLPIGERHDLALASAQRIGADGLGDTRCVHGHFLPMKYLKLRGRMSLKFVTWLRDPIERLVSHYYYWQETYDRHTSAPHHREVIEQRWTLEEFCLSHRFRNVYTQYLWAFPLEYFTFIGITAFYDKDIAEFGERFLGCRPPSLRLNTTGYNSLDKRLDAGFLEEVRAFHGEDMRLYRRALALRTERRLAAGLSLAT